MLELGFLDSIVAERMDSVRRDGMIRVQGQQCDQGNGYERSGSSTLGVLKVQFWECRREKADNDGTDGETDVTSK